MTDTFHASHANGAVGQRVWIFQANPNKYRIEEALQDKAEDYWNLRQHASKIHIGDRVLLWVSGDEAGIYALGTVTTEPTVRPDAPEAAPYWRAPENGSRPRPRVLVRFDRCFLDQPLKKTFLLTDPILCGLRVIGFPRATNFPVTEEQWQALQEWLRR